MSLTRRFFASLSVAGIFVVVALLVPGFVSGQAPTAPAKAKVPAKAWTLSHTADGQPDLQGYWTNTTYTPLQRPNNINKDFFTKEELEEVIRHAADEEGAQTAPGTIPDVHYDFTQFGLDRSQGVLALNLRTSMIVDPPNGRVPPLSEQGKERAAERAAARKRMGAPTDMVQNQPLSVRCTHMDRVGPPMLPGAYNNTYQIIQSPGYLTILVEMLHWVRVIPLDNRPHLPSNVHQWVGSYSGRWEGNTLVIDSTNFTEKTVFQGASEKMHLIERLTRTDDDTIRYQFTVDDPSTWTKPWSAELFFKKTVGPIFEHACHEGNYGLGNTLAGARAEEKRAAAKKP
ncbi:MAG: hypothetical protein DMG16_09585 [Acidobacteria bacterium]|nr:MAG: hypothetical protein DMG16_09585 [Acidobacteriota bacterium]